MEILSLDKIVVLCIRFSLVKPGHLHGDEHCEVAKSSGEGIPPAVVGSEDQIMKAVFLYRCESWTITKLSTKESMLLNCGNGEDS